MKNIFSVFFPVLFIISGCATSSTSTAKIEKPNKYYVGLMTLVVNTDADFSELDSLTYEQHIRGKFNNLENSTFRKQLEKTLDRNLNRPDAQVRLVKSSDVFDLNSNISYGQFLEKVKETGVDGILFVKLSNFWQTTDYTTVHQDNVSTTTANTQPNAVFHTYLVDTNTLKPVWYADSRVLGIYAGFDTLNNHLARSVFRKLRKDKFIMAGR